MTALGKHVGQIETVATRTGRRLEQAIRRAVDVVASLTLIIVFLPALLAIAMLIRVTSDGPAIFRQERVGRDLQTFVIYKFRTMFADADSEVHSQEIRRQIEGGGPLEGGVAFKHREDPRITGVGRFLRRFSLDELPQLLNVLQGNMSLVGPRPSLLVELTMFPEWALPRFSIKPGLTGLWQVEGRNEVTVPEMLKLDLRYVETRSLRVDAWILVRTIPTLLTGRGAA